MVFVDADTLPTRHWLAEMTAPFADPALVVVGGHAVDYRATTPAQRFMAQLGARRLEHDFFRSRVPYVAAENMAVRRTALVAVGGWDEGSAHGGGSGRLRPSRPPICLPRGAPAARRAVHAAPENLRGLARVKRGITVRDWRRSICATPRSSRSVRVEMAALGATLAVRRAKAWSLRRSTLGLAPAERAEFARHHWDWSKTFWGGFVSMLRHRTWRPR